jgi:hypothetical protein
VTRRGWQELPFLAIGDILRVTRERELCRQ